MPDSARIPTALTIAGVDPSGGAGVLADVKAMSALGAYACAVIAALTAQNTQGVTGVFGVPAAFVRQQIDTLFADVRDRRRQDRHGRPGAGDRRRRRAALRTGSPRTSSSTR